MKSYTKKQKIIKVGNSFAVTLDKKFVDETALKAGGDVTTSYVIDPQKKRAVFEVREPSSTYTATSPLSKEQKKQVLASHITPEFESWVDKMLEEDKELLKILSNT